MEPFRSSLNPYAEPYVPLPNTSTETPAASKEEEKHGASHTMAAPADFMERIGSDEMPSSPAMDIEFRSDQAADGTERINLVEEFNLVSGFLIERFPDISRESLAEVFYMNRACLWDTLNMLEDLEGGRSTISGPPIDISDLLDTSGATEEATDEDAGEGAGVSSSSEEEEVGC